MEIIDGHVHVHRPGNPLPEHPLFPTGWGATIEELEEVLEANGAAGAVLVPVTPAEENFRFAAEACERPGTQFALIGVMDNAAHSRLGVYDSLVERWGTQGLRCSNLGGTDGDDPRALEIWPLLEAMARHGHNLWLYPTPFNYELCLEVARALPDMNVVVNLLGYPQPAALDQYVRDVHGRPTLPKMNLDEGRRERLLELGGLANAYVHFGGFFQYSEHYPYDDLIGHSQQLAEAFGPYRMLFITDWPWTKTVPGYNKLLELTEHHLPGLSVEEKSAIMGGNAKRILHFGSRR